MKRPATLRFYGIGIVSYQQQVARMSLNVYFLYRFVSCAVVQSKCKATDAQDTLRTPSHSYVAAARLNYCNN